jgi:selenium-dependent xanthine dehydrogenase
MPELKFFLNGKNETIVYESGMNLLEVLRECCGMTSIKDGCAPQGYCGCCTILVDDKAQLACMKKPESVSGKNLRTLEGLSDQERKLLADAFVNEGAVQCGYCTPGIVVRTSALLKKNSNPSIDEVRRALAGHMCRCTGYKRIEDAITTAAESMRGENSGYATDSCCTPRKADYFGESHGLRRYDTPRSEKRKDGIGGSARRYMGRELALGEKDFVADMSVDGMLYAVPVYSEFPRALVLDIDCREALRMPGISRVLTAEDVPGVRTQGLIVKDWPQFIAVGEETRYLGDVLAVVVAQTKQQAKNAAEKVIVSYEERSPVCDPIAALSPGAHKIHSNGNLLDTCAFSRGDVDGEFASSAIVIQREFQTQRIEHAFMEPEACLAVPENNRLHVYSQGQGVHDDQKQIASLLGISLDQVMVELVSNGGAFGGKEDLSVQAHTALAAWLLKKPVKMVLSREQSMRMHPKRHPLKMKYKIGADESGRLTAARIRIIGDTGAYASVGMKVMERAAGHSCGPYRMPAVDVVAQTAYTNNSPCGAMRGFGVNQTAFAIESIMNEIADKAGIDPWEIRARNILEPGEKFVTGQILDKSVLGLRRSLNAVKTSYKNEKFAGIACGVKNTGIGNGMDDIGRVTIEVLENERLLVKTGYTEMGQGLFTILTQVIADETGLDPAIMDVKTISELSVLCGMTTASRATALATKAAGRAAINLADALLNNTLGELCGSEFKGEFICDITTKPGESVDNPVTHMTFSYAAQVVILDDAGKLKKVVAAHDVGRAINPLSCSGQIEGSIHMGLGYALSEDFLCEEGRPVSLKLKDIGILRASQTPEIEVILIEEPDTVGGYGTKGVGEIGLVPTAGAVAGALRAFDGVFRNRLPMINSPAASGIVPRSRTNHEEWTNNPEVF